MNRVMLLEALKDFTECETRDLLLPTRVQKVGEKPALRPPDVYRMRLPDSKSADKKAPYYIHQLITASDKQKPGEETDSIANIRTIMCAYCEDEQEGALHLLNMSERFRIPLLRKRLIGDKGQFSLNMEEGLELFIYPDDTKPYFLGEIVSTWHMPPVEREVPEAYGYHKGQDGILRVPRSHYQGSGTEWNNL